MCLTTPVIPFIIGDGTGPDIWAAASRVLDAAVGKKAYQGRRKIMWHEVLAGEKLLILPVNGCRSRPWTLSAIV